MTTKEDGWIGRLEDRRPASNGDPYKIAAAIITTTNEQLTDLINLSKAHNAQDYSKYDAQRHYVCNNHRYRFS